MSRIDNVNGGLHCAYCLDDAQVCVGVNGIGTEQMAPCPRCECGLRLEHATTQTLPADRNGKRREIPRESPWRDGYWQGKPADLEPETEYVPLSRAENARRLRVLMDAFDRAAKAAELVRQEARRVDQERMDAARAELEKPKPSLDDMLAESEAA